MLSTTRRGSSRPTRKVSLDFCASADSVVRVTRANAASAKIRTITSLFFADLCRMIRRMADILKLPGSPRPSGYSDGIAARGRFVVTAGIVGWTAQHAFETDDFVGQARQAFANIVAILAEGGAKPEHLVRLTWYVRDRREYLNRSKEVGAA